jgi:hypothetical protein
MRRLMLEILMLRTTLATLAFITALLMSIGTLGLTSAEAGFRTTYRGGPVAHRGGYYRGGYHRGGAVVHVGYYGGRRYYGGYRSATYRGREYYHGGYRSAYYGGRGYYGGYRSAYYDRPYYGGARCCDAGSSYVSAGGGCYNDCEAGGYYNAGYGGCSVACYGAYYGGAYGCCGAGYGYGYGYRDDYGGCANAYILYGWPWYRPSAC